MDYQWCTESIAYYKSKEMIQLDYELGDIYQNMVDLEIELIQSLQTQLIPLKSDLDSVFDLICELDL